MHDLSPLPDGGWVTVRDRDYEDLVEAEVAKHFGHPDGIRRSLGLTGLLYLCPECGRLMWQRPGEERFGVFRRESDAAPGTSPLTDGD